MAPPILILRDIHLTFGGTPLLEGAELWLSPGDRLATGDGYRPVRVVGNVASMVSYC